MEISENWTNGQSHPPQVRHADDSQLMLAIGVNHSFGRLTSLWRRPELLLRSLFGVIVLVPIFVGLLLWIFELRPAVATGLAVLAASPGAPLTTKRSRMAGGDPTYSASLQLTPALPAVLVTPLILAMFIAGLCNYGQSFVPTVLAYMILGALVALPYSVWNKHQMLQTRNKVNESKST
ncbi:hypothetical protein ACFL2Q_12780 [Thermodesulfobacteriota bacterium]